ncbi:MAG: transcription termination/antitermination factor NusG [Caldilineaceae bacterium SB0666_bin_21]|nr:transcription termination/antitermination factor NusG [Caldilineaceae bacterium SB0666_bin_21]
MESNLDAGLPPDPQDDGLDDLDTAEDLLLEEESAATGWYVVNCYSSKEHQVKANLDARRQIPVMNEDGDFIDLRDFIIDVIVPTETEIEIRDQQPKEVERQLFPGYILVKMKLDAQQRLNEDAWLCVRETPGVTGFVGIGHEPTPLSSSEVEQIMSRIESPEPKVKVRFQLGERVRITSGPFAEFAGSVDELQPDKGKARVLVSIFGRDTPVEVEIVHLEQLG